MLNFTNEVRSVTRPNFPSHIRLLAFFSICFSLLVLATPSARLACGQTERPKTKPTKEAQLALGDANPIFQVERFLKGEEFDQFEKGRVYVIEFWATWCGPCIQSMTHLTELQEEYRNDKVTMIGINVREMRRSGPGWEESFDQAMQNKVEAFVAEMGDQLGFSIAYDGETKTMDRAWLGPQSGLPTTFIVNRDGVIAWRGHPVVLRMPLDRVVKGTWNLDTGPALVKQAETAFQGAMKLFSTDEHAGLEAWAEAEKRYPILAEDLLGPKFDALVAVGLSDATLSTGDLLFKKAAANRDVNALNRIAVLIARPQENSGKPGLKLALEAAEAANQVSNGKDVSVLEALALVHFRRGQLAKAIEVQTRALELADESTKSRLKERLEEFELAKENRQSDQKP